MRALQIVRARVGLEEQRIDPDANSFYVCGLEFERKQNVTQFKQPNKVVQHGGKAWAHKYYNRLFVITFDAAARVDNGPVKESWLLFAIDMSRQPRNETILNSVYNGDDTPQGVDDALSKRIAADVRGQRRKKLLDSGELHPIILSVLPESKHDFNSRLYEMVDISDPVAFKKELVKLLERYTVTEHQ